MTTLAELLVKVGIDADQLEGGIGRHADKVESDLDQIGAKAEAQTSRIGRMTGGIRNLGSSLSSAGATLRTAGAGMRNFGARSSAFLSLPLAAGFKFAFDQASDLNEAVSAADTIFASNAASIQRWSQTSAKSFGVSRQEALTSATTFGNLFTQIGIGADKVDDMSTGIVELASDFASFHNADPVAVQEALAAAFRGEFDALQRFVPTIKAAAVQQRALADTGKDSADALTEGEKAAATYSLIMEGAGDALGDFDRTADGAANTQRTLAAEAKDASAQIGDQLMPIFARVVKAIRPLVDAFSNLSPRMQQMIVFAGLALVALGPLVTIIGTLATVMGVLLGPVGLIILAIAAVIAIVILLKIHAGTLRDFFVGVWNRILGAAQAAWKWIKANWPTILAILTGPVGLAVLAIVKHWDKIRAAIGAAINWIQARWRGVTDWIKGTASSVQQWIAARFNQVVGFFTGLPGRISRAARGMFDGIKNAFKSAINSVIAMWNNFSLGFSFGGKKLPGPIPDIPSFSFRINTPNIPFLAEGGIVTGPTLAALGEGRHDEAVIPLPHGMRSLAGAAGTPIVVNVNGSVLSERDLVAVIRRELDRGGLGRFR